MNWQKHPRSTLVFFCCLLWSISLLPYNAHGQTQREPVRPQLEPTYLPGSVNTWSDKNRTYSPYDFVSLGIFRFGRLGGPINPAKILEDEGPQFPGAYSMSNFSVAAFVRGAWPVTVDYEVEAVGFILVTISRPGVEPFLYRLNVTKKGRQQETFTIPERFGSTPTAGIYSIRALSEGPGEVQPIRLRVYKFGAGEKAAESPIDNFRSEPGVIHADKKEKLSYDFHSRAEVDKADSEIRLVKKFGPHIASIQVHNGKNKDGIHSDEWVSENWDGKDSKGKFSEGVHQIKVRAWSKLKAGGDWVASWSKEFIYVQ